MRRSNQTRMTCTFDGIDLNINGTTRAYFRPEFTQISHINQPPASWLEHVPPGEEKQTILTLEDLPGQPEKCV